MNYTQECVQEVLKCETGQTFLICITLLYATMLIVALIIAGLLAAITHLTRAFWKFLAPLEHGNLGNKSSEAKKTWIIK